MNAPFRSSEGKPAERSSQVGLPAPDPDNDVSLNVVQSEPQTAIPRHPRWPLLVVLVGLVLTLLWTGFLGWLVVGAIEALF
jgi:hypothetical protein